MIFNGKSMLDTLVTYFGANISYLIISAKTSVDVLTMSNAKTYCSQFSK